MLLGICQRILTAPYVPFAPGCNDREVRSERRVSELEAHLIVAFAGATMRQRIRANAACYLYLAARDERSPHGRPEEVLATIDRAGAERRPDEALDELLPEILDVAFVSARCERLCLYSLKLIPLPDVGGDADDARPAVMLLEPRDDDGGVETS